MPQSKVLIDSNVYFRLAQSIHPLLQVEFGKEKYCLYTIEDFQKEYEKDVRLKNNFSWVNEPEYRSNRKCKLHLKRTMKLLHTSDWHIGRTLYGRKRYEEYEAFLNWLAELIEGENIDVLLVAGDVFDNSTPSNHAQELYYRFLCRVAGSANRQVIVTAGNHDSPSFLNAPRELLKFLNVHVVGCASEAPEDELIVLTGPDREPRLIVCAIPYLRDRDIRTAEAGESVEDKERKIIEGIRNHYRLVCEAAEQKRRSLGKPVPIVAMGHLFAAGGQTVDGDGVRELYIGSLAQVGKDVFPEMHRLPCPGASAYPAEGRRFGFHPLLRLAPAHRLRGGRAGEKRGPRGVFGKCKNGHEYSRAPVSGAEDPAGGLADHRRKDRGTEGRGSSAWLEIVYEGDEIASALRERLDEAVAGTGMEILRVKNNRVLERALSGTDSEETLDDLDVTEVFNRCLEAHEVPGGAAPGAFECLPGDHRLPG